MNVQNVVNRGAKNVFLGCLQGVCYVFCLR